MIVVPMILAFKKNIHLRVGDEEWEAPRHACNDDLQPGNPHNFSTLFAVIMSREKSRNIGGMKHGPGPRDFNVILLSVVGAGGISVCEAVLWPGSWFLAGFW